MSLIVKFINYPEPQYRFTELLGIVKVQHTQEEVEKAERIARIKDMWAFAVDDETGEIVLDKDYRARATPNSNRRPRRSYYG